MVGSKIFSQRLQRRKILRIESERKSFGARKKAPARVMNFPSYLKAFALRRIQLDSCRALQRKLLGSMKMRGKKYLLKYSWKNLVELIRYGFLRLLMATARQKTIFEDYFDRHGCRFHEISRQINKH